MSYNNGLDKPSNHFEAITYTGTGSSQNITGLDFAPDWVWIKCRSASKDHMIFDTIRSVQKSIRSNSSNAEDTGTDFLSSFDSGGFTAGGNGKTNGGSSTYVSWNWLAGGTAPAITYTVKVVSDSGNKYRFDDFGTSAVTLNLQEGGTYTFDQSDSSNSGHPLRFYTASDKSGGEYTTGVTTSGTAGSSGAKTVITVSASAPTLYYQCSSHSGMGGQANTNSTFGSSNFSGSIQSTVSANTTAGFSIVSWTGSGSAATIGHGLGATPKYIIVKNRTDTVNWFLYNHSVITAGASNKSFMTLNETDALGTNGSATTFTSVSSTTFGVGTDNIINGSSDNMIAYVFAEKKGYSKFGSFEGNGNAAGPFVYCGFRPAWVMIKDIDNSGNSWLISDNKRNPFNLVDDRLFADLNNAENQPGDSGGIDFLSNGFGVRTNDGSTNQSGTRIFMAFAESPFVNSNGIPTNAR